MKTMFGRSMAGMAHRTSVTLVCHFPAAGPWST